MKRCSMYALLAIAMIGCSDDDATPEPVNEEEVITTVILTLTPEMEPNLIVQSNVAYLRSLVSLRLLRAGLKHCS